MARRPSPGPALPTLAQLDAEIAKRDREARAERLGEIRQRCATLHGFVREAWHVLEPRTKFVDGWFVKALCDHLEGVTRGDFRYLLINVPPGFSKSLIVSVFWPAWEWGPKAMPELRYLATSYSQDNVTRDNLKMRDLVESDWYQDLWGEQVVLSRNQNAKLKFNNTKTGSREGRPFGSMTGGRGDRTIIDDPHSTKTAESDAERKEAVKLFRESIWTRVNSAGVEDAEGNVGSALVVIMQRLHMNDVAGTILSLGLPFVHLNLPMEFESSARCRTPIFVDPRTYEGELLFPERFDRAAVDMMKRVLGPYAVAGQLQQRPAPREGGLFKVAKIDVLDALPAGTWRRVRAWDLAATREKPGSDPDWTVGVLMARNPETGQVIIENVVRFRGSANDVKKMMRNTANRDGYRVAIRIPQDPGQAGKAQANDLITLLSGYIVKAVQPTGDKVTRATPLSSQVDADNVALIAGHWVEDYLAEIGSFPAGSHDDQVDASADAFNELAEIKPGQNLMDYYRQEAARLEALKAQDRPNLDPSITPFEGVRLIPPPGIATAYGMMGDLYVPDREGFFTVKKHDVGPLTRSGFTFAPVDEEQPPEG